MNDDRDLKQPPDPIQIRLGDVRATLEALRSGALGPLSDVQQAALVLVECEIGRLDRELDGLVAGRPRGLGHRLATALRRFRGHAPERREEGRYCMAGAIG